MGGGAPVTDPGCQPQSRRRPFLPASCLGRARGVRAVLGNPAGRAFGRGGLSDPQPRMASPWAPEQGLGSGELGGALAGCGELAVSWHRGGARDTVSVQRV